MIRTRLTALLLSVAAIGCGTTSQPAPAPAQPVEPRARMLVSPLAGWQQTDSLAEESAGAWRLFQAGNAARAEEIWQRILRVDDSHGPSLLGLAAIAIGDASYDRASSLVERARDDQRYLATELYAAEIAVLRGDLESAIEIYAAVSDDPQLPSRTAERYEGFRRDLSTQLVSSARTALEPEERLLILERAASIHPLSQDDQLYLAETHLELGRPDLARLAAEPVLIRPEDPVRLDALFAEIAVAERRFEDAIDRYETLVRTTGDPRFLPRLERVKVLWHESTLPAQFQTAVESPAITREDLAVLLFWKVPGIRFAQRVGQPPIAVDLENVRGREELVRALALGLLGVDSGTRRASPERILTAQAFLEIVARTIDIAAPRDACGSIPSARPLVKLEGCGVDTLGVELDLQRYVDGRTAYEILEQVAALAG